MEPRFLLLGFGEVHIGPNIIPLSSTKPSVVLATLLLRANEPISIDRLHEVVWGGAPPVSARATLQTYVLRLRQMLARHGVKKSPIKTVPRGYAVEADTTTLDILQFRSLVEAARRVGSGGDLREESRLLSEALSLWRGDALANVHSEILQREEIPRLAEEWLEATERRTEVELILGRHRNLISELRPLTATFPRRERFWEQLVEALYRSGRQAEALDEYRKIKKILCEDLGLDPSHGLQQLELTILRGESLPDRSSSQPSVNSGTPEAGRAACQLPLAVPDFVGRAKFIARVVNDLVPDETGAAPSIVAIKGAPGVGKSALAVRVAHQLREAFPDGQWYVRMTDAKGHPRQPVDALIELMQAAGVDGRCAPDAAARPAMLRALLTDRRVLLVLDDVASVDQVLPLLPGTSGCGVLVTSRAKLAGLTALLGVRSHLLGPFSSEESTELLVRMIGRDVVESDREAVDQLAELCDHVALALRIAAARIADEPVRDLAATVRWLRTDTLRKLSIEDHDAISIRRAYDASCARLTTTARKALRLIGGMPDTSPTVAEVAAWDRAPVCDIETAVEELVDASLLRIDTGGRLAMQSLVRRYARELGDAKRAVCRGCRMNRSCDSQPVVPRQLRRRSPPVRTISIAGGRSRTARESGM